MPKLELSDEELTLIANALDSHEYWQLTPENQRNDGYSQIPDGASPEIDACRALHSKVTAAGSS